MFNKTGLHYNRYRYYSLYVGCFISKDPIGLLGGFNGYVYAPNPVEWIDPLGLTRRGRHGNLRKVKNGGQSHHLNQDAAFKKNIPHKEGAAVQLEGNAFCDIGSDHYNAHESLEEFWDDYRKGGSKYPAIPTIAEYNKALSTSLSKTSLSAKDRYKALSSAIRQQKKYGLNDDDLIPNIPGKLRQKKR
ncbi:TPA: RHS repeat-associated core domain-containing protein [Acinetobacter baumannii]